MRYTVVWLPAAQTELARLWNQASDRGAVASASDPIDRMLHEFPSASAGHTEPTSF